MNGFDRPSADLFAELNRLHQAVDQLFRATPSGIRAAAGNGFPILNVGATPDTIEVQALAPGLDAKQLDITVDRGLLVIAGERASALPADREHSHVYARERFAGRFRRVVSLPEDADPAKVDATYRDGILRITVARRESAKPRRIEVN